MPAPDADAVRDLLALQEMEQTLVRMHHRHPGALRHRDYERLRYALGFARLTTFQPGAARAGRRLDGPDVEVVREPILRVRREVLERASKPLRNGDGRPDVVPALRSAATHLHRPLGEARARVLEHHAGDFDAEALDAEVGTRALVTVSGGGGGAAWVYVGAFDVLQEAGLAPRYVVGSSMGAVLGLFRARDSRARLDDYVGFVKQLRFERIFRIISRRIRFGFPGLLQLFLHRAIGRFFRRPDGEPMRLPDLEIPYEAVVAGIRRNALAQTPEEYAKSHHLDEPLEGGWITLGARVARQLGRLVEFVNPRIAKEIVIGADPLTADFDAVDAAGFSAAIPGILHYDLTRHDPSAETVLHELLAREEVVALVDGGVANNVPARVAWYQVQRGKIGTRNPCILAFDSLYPQWSPKHLWMQPLTRALQFQVELNRPYADLLLRFHPTLSPVTLLPGPRAIDRAIGWGRRQMASELPFLLRFLEPVPWTP